MHARSTMAAASGKDTNAGSIADIRVADGSLFISLVRSIAAADATTMKKVQYLNIVPGGM